MIANLATSITKLMSNKFKKLFFKFKKKVSHCDGGGGFGLSCVVLCGFGPWKFVMMVGFGFGYDGWLLELFTLSYNRNYYYCILCIKTCMVGD